MTRQWLYEGFRYKIAQEQMQRLATFRQTGLCLHVPERWPKNTVVRIGKKAMRALFAMTGEGQAQRAKAEAERAIKKARRNG